MSEHGTDEEQKKAWFTAVRIPAVLLVGLIVLAVVYVLMR